MQASFGLRLGGEVLDTLLAGAVLVPVLVVYVLSTPALGSADLQTAGRAFLRMHLIMTVVTMLVQLLLELLAGTWRGQTYGKHLVKSVVVDSRTGQPGIGLKRAAIRFLAKWLSQCLLIGPLWMLWDPNQRTLHDLMTGTTVVQGPADRAKGPVAFARTIR